MSGNRRAIAALVLLLLAASCSGDDGPAPAAAGQDVSVASAGSAPTTAADLTATSTPTTAAPAEAPASTPPPAPPPDSTGPPPPSPNPSVPVPVPVPVSDPPQTGVPGGDGEPVCRGIGTLLVSAYLVGLVEAFVGEPDARRVEAAAAPAILAAYDDVTGVLAAAGLAGDPFAARWAGPVARARTATGAADLAGAGLGARWLDLLATHDRNDPVVVLGLDPEQSAAVETAATAIAAAHGPLATDADHLASVVVATPAIDAHLAQRCPEVAALTAGDAV